MNPGRAVAAVALVVFATGCGSPAPTPTTAVLPSSTSPVASRSAPPLATPSGAVTAACRLADPADVVLPAPLAMHGGVVSGLSDTGELLVSQVRGAVGADRLSIYDPKSGSTELVVERQPARDQASATRQIASGIASADWIVWSEVGFTLEEGDWSIWAKDRHSGDIHKVKSFDPGSSGRAVPGWESSISLLGDTATWSAPIEVNGGKVAPRIYVADLRGRTVARMDVEARWPFLLAPSRIAAMVATGTDPASGKVLATPAEVDLPDGKSSLEQWTNPARTLAFAASGAGQIATQLVRADEGENPSIARVVTLDTAGTVRTFELPVDWGPVAAGSRFLAWQDQRTLWILPSGGAVPTEVASVPDDTWGIAFLARGPFVYWWTDNVDAAGVHRLGEVTCSP